MMAKTKTAMESANWQVTATTIQCDMIDDLVTIMVNKDWSTRCVWYSRHKGESVENKRQKSGKSIRLKTELCTGPECSYVTNYRDKLIQEESGGK